MQFAAAFVVLIALCSTAGVAAIGVRLVVLHTTRRLDWARRLHDDGTLGHRGCGHCGYPIDAWTSNRCPECGSAVEAVGTTPLDARRQPIGGFRRVWMPLTLAVTLLLLFAAAMVLSAT